eukprot:1333766-Amorphochlora_amoeboformis.AAC.1
MKESENVERGERKGKREGGSVQRVGEREVGRGRAGMNLGVLVPKLGSHWASDQLSEDYLC